MKKIVIILLIFLNFFSCYGNTISSINSIESETVKKFLPEINQDTLVLIDINHTIVSPKSKIFSSVQSPHFSLINHLINYRKKHRHGYDNALINWYNNKKIKLVEDNWPKAIEEFKSKGAKVIGIAGLDQVWHELIDNPEKKLYQDLKSLNINFTKQIGNSSIFKFSPEQTVCAFFYHGIIFSSCSTDKEAILQFLKKTTLMPKSIVFFSYNEKLIEHISELADDLKINFDGFVYKHIYNKSFYSLINQSIIELQHKKLLESAQWIEDDEAEQIINANN